jgi:hypothetical protein
MALMSGEEREVMVELVQVVRSVCEAMVRAGEELGKWLPVIQEPEAFKTLVRTISEGQITSVQRLAECLNQFESVFLGGSGTGSFRLRAVELAVEDTNEPPAEPRVIGDERPEE